jgi:hypothetical protein
MIFCRRASFFNTFYEELRFRSPFTVHRSPFAVRRSPFSVWRLAFGVIGEFEF